MLSRRNRPLPGNRPIYGAEALRRSRDGARLLTGGFVLLLGLTLLPGPTLPVHPSQANRTLMMEVRFHPPVEANRHQHDAMRRLLADDSPQRVPPAPQPEPEPKPEPVPDPVPPVAQAQPVKPRPRIPKKNVHRTPPTTTATPPSVPSALSGTSPSGTAAKATAGAAPETNTAAARREAAAVLLQTVERHKKYPKQARRTGEEGIVELRVSIGRDGRVRACALARPSGRSILDAATERLGEKLLGLDIPAARGQDLHIVVPVRYALREAG